MLGSYLSAAVSATSPLLAPSVRRILYRRLHPDRHRHFEKLRRGRTGQYSLQSFDEHRCIFVHIPKTGGVSVAKGLLGRAGTGFRDAYTEEARAVVKRVYARDIALLDYDFDDS